MTIQDAFKRFAFDEFNWGTMANIRGKPDEPIVKLSNGKVLPAWPFLMTAAVWLTLELESCKTNHDLRQAAEHFGRYLLGSSYTEADWQEETAKVVNEVFGWAEAA